MGLGLHAHVSSKADIKPKGEFNYHSAWDRYGTGGCLLYLNKVPKLAALGQGCCQHQHFQSVDVAADKPSLSDRFAEAHTSKETLCNITGKNISNSALSLELAGRDCSSGPEEIWAIFLITNKQNKKAKSSVLFIVEYDA